MEEDDKPILLSEAKCPDCKFFYRCKDDDGSWYVCSNNDASKYLKHIDRDFGCSFFEKYLVNF